MPDVQNLYPARFRDNFVIDVEWGVQEPSDACVTTHGLAQICKLFQQINMVQQRISKTFSRVVLPGPTHDLLEVN